MNVFLELLILKCIAIKFFSSIMYANKKYNEVIMDNMLTAALGQTKKVLIGLGEEWAYNYKNISNDIVYKSLLEQAVDDKAWLVPYIQYHYMKNHEDPRKEAFNKLFDLIKDKDYFMVSTIYDFGNDDDLFDPARMVFPCGNIELLQQKNSRDGQLIPVEGFDEFEQLMLHIDKALKNNEKLSEIKRVIYGNDELIFNQKRREWSKAQYNESAYLPQWNKYQSWLSGTLSEDLLILELGVGLEYPTVIRFPFEKIAYINNKAYMIRVHEKLYQLTEQISKKAVSVQGNSMDYIKQV